MADTGVWVRQLVFQFMTAATVSSAGEVTGHEFIDLHARVYCRADRFKRPLRVVFGCQLQHETGQQLMQTASYRTFILRKCLFFTCVRTLLPRRRQKGQEVGAVCETDKEHKVLFRTVTALTPALRRRLLTTLATSLG